MQVSTRNNRYRLRPKPATASTEAHAVVTSPTGYTLGTAAAFTTTTRTLLGLLAGTAWPGNWYATNVTGQ